jgi:hypothetical protein
MKQMMQGMVFNAQLNGGCLGDKAKHTQVALLNQLHTSSSLSANG